MDSPPECVLSLSNDIPQSPPTLPSLDHSPQTQPSPPDSPSVLPLQSPEPSPQSPSTTPSFPLSPFGLDPDDNPQEDSVENEEDEESEGLDGVPASPTPAVALFPGGGGQEAGCSPILDSSPPSTPSAPPLGFGALEVALSAGQKSTEELDLQLFQKDTIVTKPHLGVVGSVASSPALRFPCHVCGKRFRFQSILSLHARAHSLDRRASAIYRTSFPAAPLKQHLKVQQNIKDSFHINQSNQRLLPNNLIHLMQDEESEIKELEGLQSDLNPNFLLDGSTPLTPPLTEDPITSPYASNQIGETSTSNAPAFRCHACKGKFRTASELARHVRILHNPYKCTLCPFSASQEEILASHLQESHPAPDTPPAYIARPIVASPETPIPTPSHTPAPNQQASQTIGAAAASPAVPAFRCETCGQRFTQSWFLKGHMRKHKDSLDHKCQVCGRGFKEPWFLKNHMKVHLNKLGLKSGLAGSLGTASSTEQLKGAQSNQLNALYSSLLLAQRGGGGRGRADRESRLGMGSSKSAILGYLGLPSDGGGSSCMERLQAVAQVAEMGNGGSIGGVEQRKAGGNSESPGGLSEAGDQAAWWQLVARSIAVAQQQQQQQSRPQQRAQKGPGRNSMISEADQVRAYLSGINQREESGSTGANAGSWECPDCGKLFRSLQQVVVHAKVHAQRGQKSGAVGGGGEEDTIAKSHGAAGVAGLTRSEALRQELHSGGTSSQQTGEARQGSKTHIGGVHIGGAQQAALETGFHSVISNFKGENGLPSVSTMPALPSRERVRGRGIKDCPYCGKAFRSSHHLKVHLRVHTGERPYKCPHCDYAGTQSGSLKYHLQRHHREQRNALAAAAAANSSSAGLTAALNSHSLASGAMIIKRRSQQSHGPINRSSTDTHASRTSNQQSPYGLLGFPDQNNHHKALSALKDVDLESQYRYLSGMMGTLYQEGNWIRESPPQKVQKVSRRKPLTTSRMVQPTKDGPPKQEGGFEPLDLSRRTPPLGGAEEDGMVSFGDFESEQTGIMLSQCVFCPFRTSSAELMAMHLQVNHTSKSRRKRSPPVALDVDGNTKLLKSEAINPVSPGMWKDMSGSDNQALDTWSEAASSHTHNGLLSDPVTQDDNLSENVVNHFKEIEDDNQEEYLVGHLNESSLENSPGADQDTGMSGSVSPAAISNVEEDDELD